MNPSDFWKECIATAAEESSLAITDEQLAYIASAAEGAHENYGLEFYSPPPGDRIAVIEGEWKKRLNDTERIFNEYRHNAEAAIKQALRCRPDDAVSIGEYGEVTRHGGRSERIQ